MTKRQAVVDLANFDREEFFGRWERARKAALANALKSKNISTNPFQSERELLLLITTDLHDLLFKNVYDNSRKFAQSAVRFMGITLELDDFEAVLKLSDVPCFGGQWDASIESKVLRRSGCPLGSELKSLACDYYREALDGFIMGSSEYERYTRHESVGHGDKECVDVFFIENPKHEENLKIRFKPISFDMRNSFEKVKNEFKQSNIEIKLLGLNEGKLYYMLEPKSGPLCQSTGKYFHQRFENAVKSLYPNILVQDMLPVAVYGSGA